MGGQQRKVLVIDDSAITLEIVSGVLGQSGYDVRASLDVTSIGTMFGAWRPDVILTDVNMPGISGVELCRRLKSSYETAHVPVVLYSAIDDEDLATLARECEADGFLSKSKGIEALPKELAFLFETSLF